MLTAINTMLSVIGESPISSLEGDLPNDAVIAKQVLEEITKEVQNRGWSFNTEYDISLVPDGDSHISTTGFIRVVYEDPQFATRDGKVFDKTNHTFLLTSHVKAKKIIYLFTFDQLPISLQRYVEIRAARTFQRRVIGGQTSEAFTQQEELLAHRDFLADEVEAEQINILDNYTNIYRRPEWL